MGYRRFQVSMEVGITLVYVGFIYYQFTQWDPLGIIGSSIEVGREEMRVEMLASEPKYGQLFRSEWAVRTPENFHSAPVFAQAVLDDFWDNTMTFVGLVLVTLVPLTRFVKHAFMSALKWVAFVFGICGIVTVIVVSAAPEKVAFNVDLTNFWFSTLSFAFPLALTLLHKFLRFSYNDFTKAMVYLAALAAVIYLLGNLIGAQAAGIVLWVVVAFLEVMIFMAITLVLKSRLNGGEQKAPRGREGMKGAQPRSDEIPEASH